MGVDGNGWQHVCGCVFGSYRTDYEVGVFFGRLGFEFFEVFPVGYGDKYGLVAELADKYVMLSPCICFYLLHMFINS